MIGWLRSDTVDRHAQGQIALLGFSAILDFVRELRSSGAVREDQFVDSHYVDLIANPVAAIRKIYDRAGLAWPDGHDETIERYLRDKPKGKFGKHEYRLEDYGLSEQLVEDAYSNYTAHYGVERESA
jgi:hypothetical protein